MTSRPPAPGDEAVPAESRPRLGVCVPTAFPGPPGDGRTVAGAAPPGYLLGHLERLVGAGFEAVEMSAVADPSTATEVAGVLAGLEVVYAAHLVQRHNAEGLHPFDLSHPEEAERRRAVERVAAHLQAAYDLGATQVVVATGRDPSWAGGPPGPEVDVLRREMVLATTRSVFDLAELAARGGMGVALLAGDRRRSRPDRPDAFATRLLGPAVEALAVVAAVRHAGGTGAGVALDTAHLAINGEGAEELLAAQVAAALSVVHLSNCVLVPTEAEGDRRVGDRHPRFGCPGSVVDADRLLATAAALCPAGREVGVGDAGAPLAGGYGGPLVIDVRAAPGEDPWTVVDEARRAWEGAVDRLTGAGG